MKVADFIDEFRQVTGDRAQPQHWSDATVLRYLQEAVNEACERAKLIEDFTSSAASGFTVASGQGTYRLHPSVIEVRTLRMGTDTTPLVQTSAQELDISAPGWRDETGKPTAWLQGEGYVQLLPTPTEGYAGQQVLMTVYRRPLQDLALAGAGSGELTEIPRRLHMRLLHWTLYRAWDSTDADWGDPARAARELGQFVGAFGERIDANVQRKQRERRVSTVRYRFP